MEITYNKVTFNTDTLPAVALEALMRRGASHYFGNECASKVTAWVEAEIKEGRTPSQEAKDAKKEELQALALKALLDGTVGTSVRAPRGNGVDSVVRQIAEKEVRDILKAQKLAMPSGEKKIKFPDGTELGRVELVDRRIAKHGDRLHKEAETELKRRDREAQKAGGLDALL